MYIELKRRNYTADNLVTILDDFNTLTEYEGDGWTMGYKGEEMPFTIEQFNLVVPTSPKTSFLAAAT